MIPPTIEARSFDFRVFPMKTRFPFQYGIASMTELPHLFVTARILVNGREAIGVSSEGLAPKWFTKDPATTFEQDLPAMRGVIDHAAEIASGISAPTFFDFWKQLYQSQSEWAKKEEIPPLLANLGVSLIERAVLDGLCRAEGKPFAEMLRENRLGIRAGEIDSGLNGYEPADLLPEQPLTRIIVRHTIGLGDPLTEDDIEEPLDDGLPHSLEASIREYGLTHFKVKICGELDRDRARLAGIYKVLQSTVTGDFLITFDGNEQFNDIASFRSHWEEYRKDEAIRPLLDHILFVEQPLHRDHALGDGVQAALESWPEAPPLIIDESEAALDSLPRALVLGYSGTSHKNCKGVMKGVINAMRVEKCRRDDPKRDWVLSGEDLANVGPVALLQDLAVLASLGVSHVERNGHHYFRGLSAFSDRVQEEVLRAHGDLYRRHENDFATVRIASGRIEIRSVVEAPFGVQPLFEGKE
jgi:hypothetical protein